MARAPAGSLGGRGTMRTASFPSGRRRCEFKRRRRRVSAWTCPTGFSVSKAKCSGCALPRRHWSTWQKRCFRFPRLLFLSRTWHRSCTIGKKWWFRRSNAGQPHKMNSMFAVRCSFSELRTQSSLVLSRMIVYDFALFSVIARLVPVGRRPSSLPFSLGSIYECTTKLRIISRCWPNTENQAVHVASVKY